MALQDYYNTGDNSSVALTSTNWYGQSFTASSGYDVASVKFLLYRTGTPGTITFNLYAVDGDFKPTGLSLASGTTAGNDLTEDTNGEWREITFASAYTLENATKYALILSVGATGLSLRRDVSSPTYDDGNVLFTGDSGSSWFLLTTQDAMFETYSSDVSYSELAGTCAGAGDGSGDLELHTYSALTGTCAGVGAGSGDLGSVLVHINEQIAYKRLIVVGNDQVWTEDI